MVRRRRSSRATSRLSRRRSSKTRRSKRASRRRTYRGKGEREQDSRPQSPRDETYLRRISAKKGEDSIHTNGTGTSPPGPVLMSEYFRFQPHDNSLYSTDVVVSDAIMRGTYEVDTTCSEDTSGSVIGGGQGGITLCTEEVGLTYEMSIDTISQLSNLRREGRPLMILNPQNRKMKPEKLFCFISSSMWSNLEFLLGLNSVANKQIRTKTITKTFTDGDIGTAEEQYRNEIACYNALFKCPSPFLSRAVGADPETYTIKMERMAYDLFTQINNGTYINHKNLLCDMLNGLEALRQHGYAHRDIKPENVLYDDITGVYKLTDFGLSERTNTQQRSERGGSVYILPLRTHIAEGKNWGQANDKYGIGVVAWVAKMKKYPYTPPSGLRAVDRVEHWGKMKTFMSGIGSSDDADMKLIAAYFKHEVIPMIDIGETDTAFKNGTKRQRDD